MLREEAIADIRDNIKPVVGGKSLDIAIQSLTAISELSKSLKAVNRYDMDEKVLIGFNMAVAIFNRCFGESGALKNEQSEQNVGMCQQNVGEMSEKQTDGDLISRKEVLNAIGEEKWEYLDYLKREIGGNYDVHILGFTEQIEKRIEKLLTYFAKEDIAESDGDLISRKAVLKILSENRFRYNIAKEGYNEGQVLWSENLYTDNVREEIKELPSAEKTAKWINETEETIECGNCHHVFDDFGLLNGDQEKFYEYPNFCPECGCRMKGVKNE